MPCIPIHPMVQIPDELKVNALIDESNRQWNEELIRICFRPAVAKRILNISLSHKQIPDYVSWPLTKNGHIHGETCIYHGQK